MSTEIYSLGWCLRRRASLDDAPKTNYTQMNIQNICCSWYSR